jgi:tetratricopeptide (TPR) repeat protein
LERHQTLRHAVAWSYDLLDDDERRLLDRCSVFADGFDLAAATHICGSGGDEYEVLDLLDSLVRKSLVTTERVGGHARYVLLETIRQFAEDQLAATGTIAETRDRHACFFADQVVAQWAISNGPEPRPALDWLDIEFANLRVGFRWATDSQDLVTAAAIAAHTTMTSWMLQRYEPIRWVDEILDAATAADIPQLPRLYTAAVCCMFTGRADEAVTHAETALALEAGPAYDPFETGWSSLFHAVAHLFAGRIERYLTICEDMATKQGLERVLGMCGMLHGRSETAAFADTTLAAARQLGKPLAIVFAMRGNALAYAEADPARALAMIDQAIDYSREHLFSYEEAAAIRYAAAIEARHGDLERALAMFDNALESFQRARNEASIAATLADLTVLFSRIAQPEIAATLHGIHHGQGHAIGLTEALLHLRAELGEPAFDRLVARGGAMGFGDAVQYARHEVQDALRQLASQPS